SLFAKALPAENFLKVSCRLAALRTVRFIDDHCTAAHLQHTSVGLSSFFGDLGQLTRNEWKLLKGGDDDRHGTFECFRQLARVLVDLLDNAVLVFELVYRVLKLLVQDNAVSDDDHTVENSRVRMIMQRCKPVRQPADGVALSAAGRVLDQIV